MVKRWFDCSNDVEMCGLFCGDGVGERGVGGVLRQLKGRMRVTDDVMTREIGCPR